jgi:hypothetical protein
MKKLVSLTLVTLAVALGAFAQSTGSAVSPQPPTRIRITIGEQAVTATMRNNVTAREFVASLPFTMTLSDYGKREKYGHCAVALTESPGGRQKPYQIGDIGYWSPNRDFAIFYRHDGTVMPEPGITMIGTVDGDGIKAFNVTGRVTVTFEVLP